MALTQFGESTDTGGGDVMGSPAGITSAAVAAACSAAVASANSNNNKSMDSDEEMARRLAAEWGSQDMSTIGGGVDGGNHTQTQSQSSQTYKSDEDLARELHAQFEQEDHFIPVTGADNDADTQFNDANTMAAVGDAAWYQHKYGNGKAEG